ncbi:unnamed protein product [Vitrella brassicaformis CCMP3155]|uniref:Protein kinase domain-containing protein n=1 Tax=Vitrella brassicaformis (strain CCMP3155) TaxID=1169540 RepID=A0A0G4EIR3_VITBC|nr:unnamed protein product [Vitrella brassicaformis CCMP3155]|eukprot:CEL95888.1 unnamed protein product [Vitrella brassicaformis CCMP3155]
MAHPAAAAAAPQVPAFIVHNFNTIRHLGAGGYGVTWQACANAKGAAPDIDGGEDLQGVPRGPELVVKMMQNSGQFANVLELEHMIIELPDIKNCPNVMSSLGFVDDPFEDRAYLIIEYGGPTLDTKLWDHRQDGLPRNEVRDISSQLVNAHRALHRAGVIYRDHKMDNVVVGADGMVRLIDLGCFKEMGEQGYPADLNSWVREFRPTEVLLKQQYGLKADISALGQLLFWTAYDRSPFGQRVVNG